MLQMFRVFQIILDCCDVERFKLKNSRRMALSALYLLLKLWMVSKFCALVGNLTYWLIENVPLAAALL